MSQRVYGETFRHSELQQEMRGRGFQARWIWIVVSHFCRGLRRHGNRYSPLSCLHHMCFAITFAALRLGHVDNRLTSTWRLLWPNNGPAQTETGRGVSFFSMPFSAFIYDRVITNVTIQSFSTEKMLYLLFSILIFASLFLFLQLYRSGAIISPTLKTCPRLRALRSAWRTSCRTESDAHALCATSNKALTSY